MLAAVALLKDTVPTDLWVERFGYVR